MSTPYSSFRSSSGAGFGDPGASVPKPHTRLCSKELWPQWAGWDSSRCLAWDTETSLPCSCLLWGPCARPSGVTGLRCSWKPCPELGPCSRYSLAFLFLPELGAYQRWVQPTGRESGSSSCQSGHDFCLLLCPIDFQSVNDHGSERSGGCPQNVHGCGTPGSRGGGSS